MASGWQSVRLDEIDPIPVVDGTLLWRPVRRTLDIGAFGMNAYVAHNAGDDVVEEHTEQSLGHEEIYFVLAGRATFTLDDETLDAPAGTFVFVRDPAVKRHARAEEPETAVLAVGGPREAAYEPSPWEDCFAAEQHRAAGDYEAYAEELEDASSSIPTIPRRCTTSPARRRSPGGRTMPSSISRARAQAELDARQDEELAPSRLPAGRHDDRDAPTMPVTVTDRSAGRGDHRRVTVRPRADATAPDGAVA